LDVLPASVRGDHDQSTASPAARMSRRNWTPQVWSVALGKRSCEKGIRISATQPSESTLVFTSHTGSQEPSMERPSPLWIASRRSPAGVAPNTKDVV
jgi:hypothetical protein